MTLEALEAKITKLQDIHDIQNLQGRYNYYLGMYWGERVADELFARDDPSVSIEINGGRWTGFDAIKKSFSGLDAVHEKQSMRMATIMALQPLITINDDGKTANGQWYGFGPTSLFVTDGLDDTEPHLEAMWIFGRYDNDYIKENEQWKIKRMSWNMHFLSPVGKGWIKSPQPYSYGAFVKEDGNMPETPVTFPQVYNPEGPNEYGPPIPDPID